MDNHATIIDNNWSVSVTLYRDPGTPGTSDKRCFANGAAEENLKNVNFAGTSTVMNDKVSSHKSQNLQTFCP
jgi:hypothetical protein